MENRIRGIFGSIKIDSMSKEKTIKDTLSIVEKVQKLTELCYNDTKSNRFVALNDLTRKIRVCFNAIYLLPLDKYDVLCVPANLMYRCIISDLLTSLFIAVINDSQFDEVMHIMDIDFVKSLKSFGTSIIISTFSPKYFALSFKSHFLKTINLKKNSFNIPISLVWVISK